jgi:hypothetical protein
LIVPKALGTGLRAGKNPFDAHGTDPGQDIRCFACTWRTGVFVKITGNDRHDGLAPWALNGFAGNRALSAEFCSQAASGRFYPGEEWVFECRVVLARLDGPV